MSPDAVAIPTAVTPTPKPLPTIEAENLTKNYGNRRILDRVSFTLRRGDILGFLGPNGAGKTTTMRILACYTPATGGRAAIAGHDVRRDSKRARRALGYLPENAPLYAGMKVGDYLKFIAEMKGCPARQRKKIVEGAIEECSLQEVAGRLIANLSKGFRQRVGLAQAILGDPPVLILDEPTVGLDPRQTAEIRRMIKDMAGRRTVLLSTHILPEVSATCQKVIVIDRGRIVASGTPGRLVSNVEEERPVVVTIEADPGPAGELLTKLPGVARVELAERLAAGKATFHVYCQPQKDCRAEISRAVVEAGWGLFELNSPSASLEDVFLRVISAPEQN